MKVYARKEQEQQHSRAAANHVAQLKKGGVSFPGYSKFPGPLVIQRKTVINHITGKYSYFDHADKTRKEEVVGKEMKAWLDPKKVVKGSSTAEPQKKFIQNLRKTFRNDSMIRGHLLNHDLGGFAVNENLFPITSAANSLHKNTVEYGVKDALMKAKTNNKGVYYHVDVTGDYTDNKDEPVSTFVCEAKYLNDVEKTDSYGDSILKVDVISTPKKNGGRRASSEKAEAWDKSDVMAVKAKSFSRTSGLSAWEHGSRKGKLNFDDILKKGTITVSEETLVDLKDSNNTEKDFQTFSKLLENTDLGNALNLFYLQPDGKDRLLTAFESVFEGWPDTMEEFEELCYAFIDAFDILG